MIIKPLSEIKGRIDFKALTDYKVNTWQNPDDDEFGITRFSIERNDDAENDYSENAAYQYKIIRALSGYTDIIGANIGYSEDFYVSDSGVFLKSIPELVLCNLLNYSNLKFNIREIYFGMFDETCSKKTSFVLDGDGVTISLTSEKTQTGLLSIIIDCNYDCMVQFGRKSRAPRRYIIPKDKKIDLNMLAASFCSHLALCSVHIDLSAFDQNKLIRTWHDVLPLNTRNEMRRLDLVHEVLNESR